MYIMHADCETIGNTIASCNRSQSEEAIRLENFTLLENKFH